MMRKVLRLRADCRENPESGLCPSHRRPLSLLWWKVPSLMLLSAKSWLSERSNYAAGSRYCQWGQGWLHHQGRGESIISTSRMPSIPTMSRSVGGLPGGRSCVRPRKAMVKTKSSTAKSSRIRWFQPAQQVLAARKTTQTLQGFLSRPRGYRDGWWLYSSSPSWRHRGYWRCIRMLPHGEHFTIFPRATCRQQNGCDSGLLE